MNRRPKRISELLLVACCVLAGCGDDDRPEETEAERATAVAGGDSVFVAADDRVSLPSNRIYFTLTTYDWYARGEPLVHEGRPYRPSGMPVPASLPDMTRLGEYQGVEYYARAGEEPGSVYVPVYEGYWQMFRTDAEVFDTTLAAPPPADPDTASSR